MEEKERNLNKFFKIVWDLENIILKIDIQNSLVNSS
jgi:hypothetical protein